MAVGVNSSRKIRWTLLTLAAIWSALIVLSSGPTSTEGGLVDWLAVGGTVYKGLFPWLMSLGAVYMATKDGGLSAPKDLRNSRIFLLAMFILWAGHEDDVEPFLAELSK